MLIRALGRCLVALACACGPEPATTTAGGDTDKTTGAATSSGVASTAPTETDTADPFCADPLPIFMIGGEIPSGFVRCANGVTHRVEVVACAVEGAGQCQWSGVCSSDSDCVDAPHGTCHEIPILGCNCRYGCGSDADCEDGEICACAGVISETSQCVPAECVDDNACQPGLCGLTFGAGGCGSYAAKTACIDASSSCIVHDDCPQPETDPGCDGCWPEAGVWSCGALPGCDVSC